jgi:hypothetical protein
LAAPLECQLESRTMASGVGLIGVGSASIEFGSNALDNAAGACLVVNEAGSLPEKAVSRLLSKGFLVRTSEQTSDSSIGAIACFRASAPGRVEVSLHGFWQGDTDIQQSTSRVIDLLARVKPSEVLGVVIYPSNFDRAFSQLSLECSR